MSNSLSQITGLQNLITSAKVGEEIQFTKTKTDGPPEQRSSPVMQIHCFLSFIVCCDCMKVY